MTDPTQLTAVGLVEAFRAGTLDPVEAIEETLARTESWEPRINAFYRLEPEHARASAEASAARWRAGEPLSVIDGVPLTLKENVATQGTPLPGGSASGEDNPPAAEDGPVAALMERAGAVRFGKTTMPDLGMLSSGVSSLHGITRSPWNQAWTVGGSSAGASAAAAAQLGPLHSGSDIGGSVRLPASWLGLVGLKPTYGLVPVDSAYMGRTIGPLTRTVADTALFMAIATGADPRDHTQVPVELDWMSIVHGASTEPRGLRVAWHVDAGWGLPVDPEVADTVRAVVAMLSDAGAEVEEISPFATEPMMDGLDLFLRARSLADMEHMDPAKRAKVLPFVMEWAEGARGVDGIQVLDGYQAVLDLRRTTVASTLPYDVVVSPVSPGAAFPAEWPMPSNAPATSLHHIGFTAPYNFSDQPAVTVNAGFTADGRPIGVQLATRRFEDVALLRLAAWLEQARPETADPVWPS
ncbi:amidase [Demequina sp. NBRC 110054]|uniref:amidase n=1 Tax=Demequina sp. NBRC 110054 TaxID=1570343 RepID=UPI000A011127|nr:amidase [Demequina sp. NBRC 110054]